eukprot:TRINITY_DN4296_c0_g2_i1.p1 TRINITY_DN4296_c0_g2~~TRINITY_DN4296_c0_g2_i1.p1  ORF type:complete len:743 (+),score=259.51 TRINITY_DN4296_c0_g2_i1:128-2356(+)
MGCINSKDPRDVDVRDHPDDVERNGRPPDSNNSAGITAETQSRDSPNDLEEVRVVPDDPGPTECEERILSRKEREKAAAAAAAAAREVAAEQYPTRDPSGQSVTGSGASEVDIEMLELDIAEGTHPHTLVAVIVSFEGDLAVQAHGFKYLALGAYDHREIMAREDLLKQLITTVQGVVGVAPGQHTIDVGRSDSPPEAGSSSIPPRRRQSLISLPEGVGDAKDPNADRMELLTHAFVCFQALCQDHVENQAMMVRLGLIPAVMRGIERCPATDVEGIRLLSVLTTTAEAKVVFAEAQGGPFLLTQMDERRGSITLQREGCRMITQLVTSKNPQVANSFDLCVALRRLYTAKEAYPSNATLASIVAQSLQSIMTVYSALAFARGVREGELRALCEAIRVFEGSSQLTGQFASLLTKLSKTHGDYIFAEGCVGALVEVMGAVTTSVHLFLHGAQLLYDLCQKEDRIGDLVGQKSIHCLLTGLRFHPSNQPLAVTSLTALNILVDAAPDVFLADGGVATLIENLKRSVDETVHRLTLTILLQLLREPEGVSDLLHKNALQALVRSLAVHPSVAETSKILTALASDVTVAGAMEDAVFTAVAAGRADLALQDGGDRPTSRSSARPVSRQSDASGRESLKGIVSRQPLDHALFVALLAKLMEDEVCKAACVDAQAAQYVLDVANRKKTERDVVLAAVAFFELVSTDKAVVRVMRHGQGIILLQYIARHHPEHAGTCNVVLDNMDACK